MTYHCMNMPKIELKPNSPEYHDGKKSGPTRTPGVRVCQMPECREHGEYKAPKDRNLSDYYWFCLEHVQEYNKAWNYFSGMSLDDIEDYINKATTWDRPTQRYDTMANAEAIRTKAWQTYHFTDKEPPRADSGTGSGSGNRGYGSFTRNTPEFDAMIIMGLEPPLDLNKIKERYRLLAKKYHPDLNREDKDAEELLKKINMAYTVLKIAYQKYETLPERS